MKIKTLILVCLLTGGSQAFALSFDELDAHTALVDAQNQYDQLRADRIALEMRTTLMLENYERMQNVHRRLPETRLKMLRAKKEYIEAKFLLDSNVHQTARAEANMMIAKIRYDGILGEPIDPHMIERLHRDAETNRCLALGRHAQALSEQDEYWQAMQEEFRRLAETGVMATTQFNEELSLFARYQADLEAVQLQYARCP